MHQTPQTMPAIDFKCTYGIKSFIFVIEGYTVVLKDDTLLFNDFEYPLDLKPGQYFDLHFKIMAFERRLQSHNSYGAYPTKQAYVEWACTELISIAIGT